MMIELSNVYTKKNPHTPSGVWGFLTELQDSKGRKENVPVARF